jgi:hypothetical protein
VPVQLVSDRGSAFLADVSKKLYEMLDVRHQPSTAYHHQTAGQVERLVQPLSKMIGIALDGQHADWDLLLPMALYACRTARHSSTGYSPAELVYGRKLVAPLNVVLGMLPVNMEVPDQYVRRLHDALFDKHETARDALHEAREQQASGYDAGRAMPTYKVGDAVYVREEERENKLSPSWRGPMRVLRKIGAVNFEIADADDESRSKQVVHAARLKPCYEPEAPSAPSSPLEPSAPLEPPSPQAAPRVPAVLDAGAPRGMVNDAGQDREYVVEAIEDSRVHDGRRQYRVRWKGYRRRYNSWVDEDDMHAPELVSAFERVRALVDASEGRVTRAARSRLTGGMSTTASSSTK